MASRTGVEPSVAAVKWRCPIVLDERVASCFNQHGIDHLIYELYELTHNEIVIDEDRAFVWTIATTRLTTNVVPSTSAPATGRGCSRRAMQSITARSLGGEHDRKADSYT